MSHVVCLMNVEEKRATFTWSEGPAAFEPYTLDGMDYTQFQKSAESARGKLADLIKDYLYAEENVPQATYDLARAGWKLHESLFCPGSREAKQVRKWLEKLAQEQAVDTVEVVVDSPWSLPWNVIYDRKPNKEDFLGDEVAPDRWRPFWGLKYNMCGGRKVDPLRRMPILRDPHVLVVIDPQIRDGLPDEQRQRLAAFAEAHDLTVVHTKDDLEDAIDDQRPDLLYWLSHASPEALMLSDEPVSPFDLLQLLRRNADDEVRFGGLAFLNACQTAEVAGEEGSFFEAFHKAGFAGMIGTEHQTIDQFANPLGLDFLEAFLDGGESVGSVLRKLRGRVPLGLLYGTYCPPDIRVERGDQEDSIVICQLPRVEGVALGVATAPDPAVSPSSSKPQPPLPPDPYRSLAYYERKDRALFAGRDDDVERFATLLDHAATRILVLHGESGVGKTSFLNAGAIPFLEEECLGYRFLRAQDETTENRQGAVIFIRATNDMFGQLAQALCQFCARPFEYQTPLGETVSADLPGVLREFAGDGDTVNQATVRGMLRADPAALGQLLAAISDCLPFAAVLVIDQGEEVFTLAQTPEDLQRGRQALDMLRRTVHASGDFKVVFSLRTEYYGRVIDRLRRDFHDTGSIREYLLTDFGEQALIDAIQRPTSANRISHAAEIPFDKYGFRYDEGVAEEIAQRVIRFTTQRQDSVLPLVQVICTQLYGMSRRRDERTITLADLETLGGIEGGMRSHVDGLLCEMLKRHPQDKRPLQRLFTQLYLRQPDGTLTTALMAEDDVRRRWKGRLPFERLLESARDVRLLKVNSLRIGFENERRYVSLGHDALAKIAADWDEELSRGARLRKMMAAIAAVSALALLITGVSLWAFLYQRRIMLDATASTVDAMSTAQGIMVPSAIRNLKSFPSDMVRAKLRQKFETADHVTQLSVAYALARYDDVRIEFLVSQIKNASPNEVDNLVTALGRRKAEAISVLKAAARKAEREKSWRHKARLAMLALHLKHPSLVQTKCQLRSDTTQRTVFIDECSIWHGRLSALAELLASCDDGFLRSSVALAVASAPASDVSDSDKRVWESVLSNWYATERGTFTHSSASFALRKWKLKPPGIPASRQPRENRNWHVNSVDITMLLIPAGSFVRKDPDADGEAVEQKIKLTRSFLLADREVTRRQFLQFINDRDTPDAEKPLDWQGADKKYSPTEQHPVQQVSWYDAILYCNWLSRKEELEPCYELTGEREKSYGDEYDCWRLNAEMKGYRLPTEAEWEHACRAGTTTLWAFGNDESSLNRYAVYYASSTAVPGSKLPNAWGLFDLHGNVWEWCQDWHGPFGHKKQLTDPTGPSRGYNHVWRGGSFSDVPSKSRSAYRHRWRPKSREINFGFRVARTYP